MKHRWLVFFTSRSSIWIAELLFFWIAIAQAALSFIMIDHEALGFQLLWITLTCLWCVRTMLHFWYRLNDSRKKLYLALRITCTSTLCIINIIQVYLIADIEDYHGLWLSVTLFIFTHILLEICVYYRVNVQIPDNNGMITRFPTKQESFVHSIPANQLADTDNRPLIHSLDGSIDEHMKSFRDKKVLYIMLVDEKAVPRPSWITEK